MNIVKGNTLKKDADTVCVFCNKTFINRENRRKHTEKCHKGTSDHTIGKKKKEYVCIRCGKNYVNQRILVNHTMVCEGDMCLTAPLNISDQELDGGEIEICSIPTQQYSDPTLAGNPSRQRAECLVSTPDTTSEGTVLG